MDFSQYGEASEEWQKLEATLPVPPILSDQELQRSTNETRVKTAREEMKQLAHQVVMQDWHIPTRDGSQIEARTYRSAAVSATERLPIYVHFHGGGFFFGTLASEDATCSRIALQTQAVVVNANYRHTPAFNYPIAWHDSEDALAWVAEHAGDFAGDQSRIVVGGVSAGAYLTAALMLTLHREQNPLRRCVLGQVLMIPPLVHKEHSESYVRQLADPGLSSWIQLEFAPILPVSRIDFFNSMAFQGPTLADDRRANPGLASADEIAALPPATFGICGADPLRDEGLIFAKMLQQAGVPTNVHVFKGLPHGFRRFGDKLPHGSRAWDDVYHGGIKWALVNPQPSPAFVVHVH